MDLNLSVIGLGKLGACTAACFTYKGYKATGVDITKEFTDGISDGEVPIVEPSLQELITASKGRLKGTQDYEEAVRNSHVTFLVVPTPSREDGHFSDKFLRDAIIPAVGLLFLIPGLHVFIQLCLFLLIYMVLLFILRGVTYGDLLLFSPRRGSPTNEIKKRQPEVF